MARRSLRPQLNQIRAWVRQGRTDAWIAHQLDISATELSEFRRQHDLNPDDDSDATTDVDLRDEIEAEIEAAAAAEEVLAQQKAEQEAAAAALAPDPEEEPEEEASEGDDEEGDDTNPTARRKDGRAGAVAAVAADVGNGQRAEGTFDHAKRLGLWLDPAIQDLEIYTESWAGNRDVTVTVEADQIIIRRAGEPADSED
jgi:hypothetical protein